LGLDYLDHGGVDRVFAFRLAYSIRAFSKKMLTENADSTFLATPANKQQIVFIENHDTPRFSFGVKGDIDKLKIGAALNLLMGGVPSIYYGQELGMTGNSATFGATDANELPDREAFEWYKTDQGKGMAYWYKQKGPHKDTFNNDKPNDGISLEEEQNDPNSLWNFYCKMIAIRKANPIISTGTYKTLANDNDKVFSFMRHNGNKQFIVAVNLSDKPVAANITRGLGNKLKIVYGKVMPVSNGSSMAVNLPAWGVQAWACN
jgi:alpha-amylase